MFITCYHPKCKFFYWVVRKSIFFAWFETCLKPLFKRFYPQNKKYSFKSSKTRQISWNLWSFKQFTWWKLSNTLKVQFMCKMSWNANIFVKIYFFTSHNGKKFKFLIIKLKSGKVAAGTSWMGLFGNLPPAKQGCF